MKFSSVLGGSQFFWMAFSGNLTSVFPSLFFIPPNSFFLDLYFGRLCERRYGLKIISASDFYNYQAKIMFISLFIFLGYFSLQKWKKGSKTFIKFPLTKSVGIVDIAKTRLRKALGLVGNYTIWAIPSSDIYNWTISWYCQ